MKKMKMVYIAVVVVFGLALVGGCSDGGGGGGVPGLPGPTKASDLKSYDSTLQPVASESEAIALLTKAQRITGTSALFGSGTGLIGANSGLYSEAFEKKYESTRLQYFYTQSGKKSASTSVSFDNNAIGMPGSSYNDTKVAIKGKNSESYSSNTIYGGVYGSAGWEVGDYRSTSASATREFILNDFVEITVSSQITKVAGFIKTEYKNSEKRTLKKKAVPDKPDTANEYEDNTSSGSKIAVALTVSDGTNGAKFRFSWASEFNNKERSVESSYGDNVSALEVYDNDNKLLFTINNWDIASTWKNFPDYVAENYF